MCRRSCCPRSGTRATRTSSRAATAATPSSSATTSTPSTWTSSSRAPPARSSSRPAPAPAEQRRRRGKLRRTRALRARAADARTRARELGAGLHQQSGPDMSAAFASPPPRAGTFVPGMVFACDPNSPLTACGGLGAADCASPGDPPPPVSHGILFLINIIYLQYVTIYSTPHSQRARSKPRRSFSSSGARLRPPPPLPSPSHRAPEPPALQSRPPAPLLLRGRKGRKERADPRPPAARPRSGRAGRLGGGFPGAPRGAPLVCG